MKKHKRALLAAAAAGIVLALGALVWFKPAVLFPSRHAPSEVFSWGGPGGDNGEFSGPNAIAIDRDGNVYVADDDIQKFDRDGHFIERWAAADEGSRLVSPAGIAIGTRGRVYVTDAFNRVLVYNRHGRLTGRWGNAGTAHGEFHWSNGVTIGPDGEVYVVDTHNARIQKFSDTGEFLLSIGAPGSADGQFSAPYGVAADAAGNIYVADTGNDRLQKFDRLGKFLTAWGSRGKNPGEFHSLMSVAVDPRGFVHVADFGNNRIQTFDADGHFLSEWSEPVGPSGRPRGVRAVASSLDGSLYIIDQGNDRIIRLPSPSPEIPPAP